jgi:hypothetical protein
MLTVGVPVMENPVEMAPLHKAPPAPLQVMDPVPKANTLVLAMLELKNPVTTDLLFRSRVPAVSVSVRVDATVSASSNCQDPPTPLKDVFPRTVALVVTVLAVVATRLRVPVLLHTVPDRRDRLPFTLVLPVPAKVTVPAETVKSRQFPVPVLVTV